MFGTVVQVVEAVLLLLTVISIWVIASQVSTIRKLLEDSVAKQAQMSTGSELWGCPKCKDMNPNSLFQCEQCGYKLT
jgi:hypothetical protein